MAQEETKIKINGLTVNLGAGLAFVLVLGALSLAVIAVTSVMEVLR